MSPTPVILPAHLDIRIVAELRAQLIEKLKTPDLEIDGSAVERCDTAGAQLLAALARFSARSTWRLSTVLKEQLTALGFEPSLFPASTT